MSNIIRVQETAAVKTNLANANVENRSEFEMHADDFENTNDEANSDYSLFETFYASKGFDAIVFMNKFSVLRFNHV